MFNFRRTLTFLMAIATAGISLSAQVFQNSQLTVTKLKDHVWVVETSDNCTMYIIEGSKKALLIDTGTRCDSLDKIVRKITPKPLEVVLTHGHSDHAGNIHYFDDVFMHKADFFMVQGYQGKVNFVDEGYVFDLGDRKIEVCHTPAHTPGSIILLDRANGDCYSGDAFGSNQVWLQLQPLSPITDYIKACKRMLAFIDNGIPRIYCGHYVYLKKPIGKEYMTKMLTLAEELKSGTAKDIKPFRSEVPLAGYHGPLIASKEDIAIVYDPSILK
jgi:glyoxylase-like metal-dependent hydrolase (beta-lactamase superfamily II)